MEKFLSMKCFQVYQKPKFCLLKKRKKFLHEVNEISARIFVDKYQLHFIIFISRSILNIKNWYSIHININNSQKIIGTSNIWNCFFIFADVIRCRFRLYHHHKWNRNRWIKRKFIFKTCKNMTTTLEDYWVYLRSQHHKTLHFAWEKFC